MGTKTDNFSIRDDVKRDDEISAWKQKRKGQSRFIYIGIFALK